MTKIMSICPIWNFTFYVTQNLHFFENHSKEVFKVQIPWNSSNTALTRVHSKVFLITSITTINKSINQLVADMLLILGTWDDSHDSIHSVFFKLLNTSTCDGKGKPYGRCLIAYCATSGAHAHTLPSESLRGDVWRRHFQWKGPTIVHDIDEHFPRTFPPYLFSVSRAFFLL
jgi:hypothetical protein